MQGSEGDGSSRRRRRSFRSVPKLTLMELIEDWKIKETEGVPPLFLTPILMEVDCSFRR